MTTIVGTGAAASGTGSISPALPTGTTTGDLLIMFIETGNEAVTLTSGWTEVNNSPVAMATAQATRLTVWWKRAAAGESAPTIADPGDHVVARILGLRDAASTSPPFNATAAGTEATSDTSASFPTVTTTVPSAIILNAIAIGTDVASTAQFSAWTNASLTSLVEQIDTTVADGNGGGIGVNSATKGTAGAVSATTATVATAATKAMMTIAVTPRLMSTLTDDFSAASIDTVKWSRNYGTTVPTQSGGVMTIPCRAGEFDGAASGQAYAFDDWRCQLTPPGGTLAAGSYIEAGVKAGTNADGTDAVFYIDLATNLVYPSLRVNYSDGTATGIAYAPTGAHKYLRMVASGTNVLFQTSADGITYSTLRTVAMPSWMSAGPANVGWHVEAFRQSGTGTDATIDDFNLAPANNHPTTGTAAVALSASAAGTSTRTFAKTAAVATSASATRSSTRTRTGTGAVTTSASAVVAGRRTTSGTGATATSATAARSSVRTTTGAASVHPAATASTSRRAIAAGTSAVSTSATASTTTTRPAARTATVATSASATRATARATARTGAVATSATATSSRAGRTSGTGATSVTASSASTSRRTTTGAAAVSIMSIFSRSTTRTTSGVATAHVTATAVVDSSEGHDTAGTATAHPTATAVRASTRTTAGTGTAHTSATGTTSSWRPYARTATVSVTATAEIGSVEHHVTAGTGRVTTSATASATTRHVRAGTATATITASAVTGHDEQHITTGTAYVYVTASAAPPGGSGHPVISTVGALTRAVSTTAPVALASAGRPARDTSVTRPRRVTG